MSWDCTCADGWVNSALSPVVYGDIALSIKINTKIHTIQKIHMASALKLR